MAVLYDQFGREIPARETRRPDTRVLAVAQIRDRWSSYPSGGLTPERLARIFKEADNGDVLRQSELFEEIEEKDPHIASQFQIRKLAVQGLEYEILPGIEDDTQAKKVADFCREVIDSIEDWDEIILDMLDAIPKGYSMLELLWDTSGKEARPRDIKWVHPKKVTFWNSLTPRVLTEEEPVQGIDPPPFKFVYHRYKARSGYDTRAGILRVCAWMYLFKNYGIKDWLVFCEIYGMPLRVGKYEPGASSDDKKALLAAVQSLGSDVAGIISKSTEIEFIEAQKTGSLNVYESLTNFCDNQASKAILGQTLTSESGGSKGQGSYSLGKVHAEVRQDLVEADAKALGKTITKQLLRPLVGFNFGWDVPVPRFKLLYEPPEDLKEFAGIYKTLREIGLDYSQEHVSERFKVPMRKPAETPMLKRESVRSEASGDGGNQVPEDGSSRLTPDPSPAEGAEKAKRVVAGQSGNRVDLGQAALDDLVQRLGKDGENLRPMLQPVMDYVLKAASYEELMEGLFKVYGKMDPESFEEVMRKGLFAADLWGYLRSRQEAGEGGE